MTVGEEGTTEEAKRGTVSQSEHTVFEEEWEEQSKRVVVQGVEEGGGGRKVHALTHASETSVRCRRTWNRQKRRGPLLLVLERRESVHKVADESDNTTSSSSTSTQVNDSVARSTG